MTYRQPRAAAAALTLLTAAVAASVVTAAIVRTVPDDTTPPAAATSLPPAGVVDGAAVASPDPAVDLGDPGAVCDAFAAALFTADTATDSGPVDAYRRAAAYATTKLATDLTTVPARTPASWHDLVAHDGQVNVEVHRYDGEIPPPAGEVVYQAAVVVTTVTGRDGWQPAAGRHTVYCTLHGSQARWRVAAYNLG
jgi:hypothetical protein